MIEKIRDAYRQELTEIKNMMDGVCELSHYCELLGCLLNAAVITANDFSKTIESIVASDANRAEKPSTNYSSTLPTDYDPTKRMTHEEAIANPQPVCVLTDADGEPQGVLVQAFDERFVIEPKDFNDGEEMAWDDAMAALKKAGKTTFNKQQAYIILFLFENINAALLFIGGDELASSHWAATEYNSSNAWYVCFGSGGFGDNNKFNAYVVRAVAAF